MPVAGDGADLLREQIRIWHVAGCCKSWKHGWEEFGPGQSHISGL